MSETTAIGHGREQPRDKMMVLAGLKDQAEYLKETRQPLLRRYYMGYGFAVMATAIATLARLGLGMLGVHPPYVTYFPTIMVVAVLAGQGPGIVATLLSVVCADYFFVFPFQSLLVESTGDRLVLLLFVVSGFGISLLAGALHAREEELQSAFETSPAAMGVVDTNFVFKRVNGALARLHGRKVREYRGKTLWEAVPNIAPSCEQSIRQVMATGRPVLGMPLTTYADLEPRTIRNWEASYFPVRQRGGRVLEVGAVIFEITKTKQLEESLRQSEGHLKDAQRLAGIGSWRMQLADGVVTWSDELFRVAGLEPAERAPTFAEQEKLFSPISWKRLSRAVERAIQGGETYELELEMIRPDGTSRWVMARGEREEDLGGGGVVALQGIVQDITDRKRAKQMSASLAEKDVLVTTLQRSVEDKHAMLQEVHHRVKNNLQIISSLLAMQAGAVTDPVAVAQLADSERRVKSMAMIHEHLYRHDHMSSVDLGDYLKDLVAELFASYEHAGRVDYRLEIQPTQVTTKQAIPCGLILNELITNALKYAYPEGEGEVLVRLGKDGQAILMSVCDFGVGLPVGFDRSACKSFGLTIVDALTQQLDGVLEIGGPPGASFTVRFADLSRELADAARV